MKHAGSDALAGLAALLADLRSRNGLVEKKPGVFYRKSKAFVHFHEDQAGIYMDIRDSREWLRLPAANHAQCLMAVDRILTTS
jgi:hypothetical protein